MPETVRVAKLLIESAATLAQACAARAIVVPIDALPDIESVPVKTLLVVREGADEPQLEKLAESAAGTIVVPNVELDRMGQVKLAGIIALSHRIIDMGDRVIFLTGPFRSIIDSLVVMSIGSEYELFDTTDQPGIDEHIKRAVFDRVLRIALELGQHGREGRKAGAIFVIGDTQAVLERSTQMILNPFKGYEEQERNILDDGMTETVKEFSVLDGAFVVTRTGVIETAGARLEVPSPSDLPSGLGARHASAAGVTSVTRAVAITVSESDGTVRVWRAGRSVASL